MKHHSSALIASLSVVAMLLTTPVLSQELDEIVVTATRRAVNLQDVTLAVTAFTQADLDRGGILNVERMDLTTPGLMIGAFGAGNAITIRGLGRPNFESNTPGAVSVYVDGAYRSRGQQAWLALMDAERVEITRGPQGTLFGRNTTGGNINIVSNKPNDILEGNFDVTFGDYNRTLARGTINVPFSDTFQGRASFLYEEHDPFIENSNPLGTGLMDEDQTFFQGALRWTPSEDIEIIARAHHWEQGGLGTAFSGHKLRNHPVGGPTTPGLTNGLTSVVEFWGAAGWLCDFFLDVVFMTPSNGPNGDGSDCTPGRGSGPGSTPVPPGPGIAANTLDPTSIDYDFPAKRDVEDNGLTLHFEWDISDAVHFTSVTSYTDYQQFSEGDVDFSFSATWMAGITQDLQAFSQEFHLASIDTDPFEWLVGLYYFDEDNDEVFYDTLISFPLIFGPGALFDSRVIGLGSSTTDGFTLNYRETTSQTTSTAVFADVSFQLSDQWRAQFGGRYTEDDVRNNTTDIGGAAPRALANASKTFTNFSWKAGLEWQLTPDNMAYFIASTGYKAGFFNRYTVIIPGQTVDVEPEEIDNFAIGSKNRFLNNRLQVNAEIYWNDIDNAHTYTFDASVPTSVGAAAGKASTFGVEVELAATPSDDLHITAMLAYLDATYDEYLGFSDGAYLTDGIDVSGNKRERSPEWTASFTAAYDIDMGSRGVLTPYLQFAYKDDYFITALNDPFLDHQKSYTQTDIRLSWVSAEGKFDAEVFVTNIEDNFPMLGGFFAFGGMWIHSGPEPRMVGLRLGVTFD